MADVSVNLPEHVGISASESPVGIPAPEKPPIELDGYKGSMSKHEAVWNVSTQSRITPGDKSGCVRN